MNDSSSRFYRWRLRRPGARTSERFIGFFTVILPPLEIEPPIIQGRKTCKVASMADEQRSEEKAAQSALDEVERVGI